jgi:hypothetical protein
VRKPALFHLALNLIELNKEKCARHLGLVPVKLHIVAYVDLFVDLDYSRH